MITLRNWGRYFIAPAVAILFAGLIAGAVWAQGAQYEPEVAEPPRTAILPPPSPHWVYVNDPVFPHIIASKMYIIDGDTQQVIGMINTGYTPNLVLSPDRSKMYVTETFWSRGARGHRIDVVSTFNSRTLNFSGEVVLPKGRFLAVPKKYHAGVTPDGAYLISVNMTPATSVSIVDLRANRYLGEIETPGCGIALPFASRSFAMICADGSLLTVNFDASGRGTMQRGRPFFDGENDPVFEHPAFSQSARKAFFVSYEGQVYEGDLSGAQPRIAAAWSVLGDADRREKWRPGGWQLTSYHPSTNRLFVLMHQGGRWTHKYAGSEVWVFDTGTKRRLARVELEHHAISVLISQDDNPLLFTLSELPSLSVFDGTSYAHKGDVEALGDSPYLLSAIGE